MLYDTDTGTLPVSADTDTDSDTTDTDTDTDTDTCTRYLIMFLVSDLLLSFCAIFFVCFHFHVCSIMFYNLCIGCSVYSILAWYWYNAVRH